jgi:hypothetical protein
MVIVLNYYYNTLSALCHVSREGREQFAGEFT